MLAIITFHPIQFWEVCWMSPDVTVLFCKFSSSSPLWSTWMSIRRYCCSWQKIKLYARRKHIPAPEQCQVTQCATAFLSPWGGLEPRPGEYELDRLLIHATQRQRQLLPSPLPCTCTPQCARWHANSHTSAPNTNAPSRTLHDRWEKTQRSAVSRASRRQDSASFTSPWLQR